MTCTEKCWTPVECSHGYKMWPAGRSAPLGHYSHDYDCDEENTSKNTMHLFNEHDSNRYYSYKEGWAAHKASCLECNPPEDE